MSETTKSATVALPGESCIESFGIFTNGKTPRAPRHRSHSAARRPEDRRPELREHHAPQEHYAPHHTPDCVLADITRGVTLFQWRGMGRQQ